VKFDLGEDFSTETAVVFGEIYRHGSEWRFNAIGQGYSGGLRTMALQYGVNVG
jgi:tellurium resistance protein TerD